MRLASINLNKRLGNPAARTKLTTWLHHHNVDVLAAQEPWKPADRDPIGLTGYRPVGGDGQLFCWITETYAPPPVSRPHHVFQRIELAWLVLYHAYLDAYSAAQRARQLRILHDLVTGEDGRPVFVCGDFNLAPRPADGLTDGRTSTFTTATDRAPFNQLLTDSGLLDTTATTPPHFTVERHTAGRYIQFRCDLALLPDHLALSTTSAYDHTPRTGPDAFTDHSATLLDLPVTLPQITPHERDTLFNLRPDADKDKPTVKNTYHPHKTAMTRRGPSPFARTVTDLLAPTLEAARVLDHGCGRGSDVHHYRAAGLTADGYDPHTPFGWPHPPGHDYDLVTSVFVLNVLPDPWQRLQALRDAAAFTRPGGHLLVVTRSPNEITNAAHTGSWTPHHDGYWSNVAKGTFQRGISTEEITRLAHHVGLRPAPGPFELPPVAGASQVLLTRPRTLTSNASDFCSAL